MRGLRLHWDVALGWVIDTPVALSPSQLARVADWALPRQVDRYRALPPGDRKEQLGRAIDALKRGEVRCRVIDHDRDGIVTPFAATARSSSALISIPGGSHG